MGIRILDGFQYIPVLDDWISKTRVYSTTGSFGGDKTIAKNHADALKVLEDIRAYVKHIGHLGGNEYNQILQMRERPLLYGLFEKGDLKGISLLASDYVDSISVYRSAVYPTELNIKKPYMRARMMEL